VIAFTTDIIKASLYLAHSITT